MTLTTLPTRPELSAEAERLLAIKLPAQPWVRPTPPPPPRIGTPTVTGHLVVDLRDRPDAIETSRRFYEVRDAPDNCMVEIRLPRPQRWRRSSISLGWALEGWRDLPSVRFSIVGWSARQVREAVEDLRRAIEEFAL